MRVIDLTHVMRTDMPVYPGDGPVLVHKTHIVDRDGFAQTHLATNTHAGTHIDIASHLYDDAPGLDWLGPDNFTGRGAVVECLACDGRLIEPADIAVPEGLGGVDFILIRTAWDRHWETEKYYGEYPVLSKTACRYLGGLELKGIGLDTPSPDSLGANSLVAHETLFAHGLVIVENLCNLEELPSEGFIFSCLPLRLRDTEASPVRAVGMVF
ncbi:cyclase family protein [Pseudodesulfovibrio piezophilus]|uniref:Cyclase family protein n=1 Tax=Pseudodesulfovibrio piezophilus (strain DSM 21447 / JCM 15486 / C1TLV30) TaxID=1322246 RepID=M1WKI0_PSEP2|nr:cyclase family protein [Pseudodesulfovibrio piezophilus]CCH49636.1 Cyclase family protein [Pseudodesulfovibrio piezophilus C1TLV30]